MTPSELYELAESGNKLTHEQELVISTDVTYSYMYARDVLKARFIAGEAIIAAHSHHSFAYAFDVLKGRFEAGEAIMATDYTSAHLYAINVLKGRFEAGEDAILENADAAYFYVYHCNVPFEFISRILASSLRKEFLKRYFRD
jgi:hypothetical protein